MNKILLLVYYYGHKIKSPWPKNRTIQSKGGQTTAMGKKCPPANFECALQTFFENCILNHTQKSAKQQYRNWQRIGYGLKKLYFSWMWTVLF